MLDFLHFSMNWVAILHLMKLNYVLNPGSYSQLFHIPKAQLIAATFCLLFSISFDVVFDLVTEFQYLQFYFKMSACLQLGLSAWNEPYYQLTQLSHDIIHKKVEYAEICNLFIVAMEMIYSWVWIEVLPDQCLRARPLSESKSQFLNPQRSLVDFTVYICTNDKEKVLNK